MADEPTPSEPNDSEKKRSLRSPVWTHFVINGGMAFCKHCDVGKYKVQDSTKGTSPLKYHLLKKHPELYNDVIMPMPSKDAIAHANGCLARWVVDNDQPFTVVEQPEFKALLRSINPKNTKIAESVPQSAKTLRTYLMDCFESEAQKMLTKFKASATGQVSFTMDGWTSTNRLQFLGVTSHWIDEEFRLHNTLMGFIHFPARHTGKNISDAFVSLIQKFDSKVLAITMDNASNNDTFSEELEKNSEELGIRFNSQHRIRCFAHILNLVVQALLQNLKSQPEVQSLEEYSESTPDTLISTDINVGNAVSKIRTLVTKVRLSGQRENTLSQLNLTFGIKDIKLVLDVKTRWNSTYAMLSRAIFLKKSLQSMMQTDKELRKFALTDTEWDTLDGLVNFLKDNKAKYPSVAKMAKDYMAIPATSVPAEKAFSAGTDLISQKRGSLQPDTITAMMSLKSWWRTNL